jgi:hypothetical protein
MFISFNNFKSFAPKKNLNDIYFERINLIYGLNNSGKSSIIQLLKLFHFNHENLLKLKTKFNDFNLGSFDNILNSEKKSDYFSIFFSQGFVNRLLNRISESNPPIASLGLKYEKDGSLKNIYLILNYSDSNNKFSYDFNDLKNNKNITYFEFEFENHSRYFLLKDWQASPNCQIFSIDELVDNIFDTRAAIEKKLINAKKAYSIANAAYQSLDSTTEVFLALVSNVVINNNFLMPLFQKLFSEIFNYKGYEKINSLNPLNTPECIDTLNSVFSDSRRVSEGSHLSILRDFLQPFSYGSLEKNIKNVNPDFWKKDKSKNIETKIVNYFKLTNENGRNEEWQEFLTKDRIQYLENLDSLDYVLHTFNKLLEVVQEFDNYYEGSEVKSFYQAIGADVYSKEYTSFSKFPQEAFDLLENSIDENCTKEKCKIIFKKIIDKTYLNKLAFTFSPDNFRWRFRGDKNILNIFKFLDVDEKLKKKNAFLSDLHSLNTTYVLNPLEKLISIDNSNCYLNERYYPFRDYIDNKNDIYDSNFVINKIFLDKFLQAKINNDIELLGLDYRIKINETNLNSGNILLEPVLANNKNKIISTLYDAGHASKKIVPLLFYLNYVNDGVLTIEEPEANLHPKYQANLANIFVNSLIENNNELVIETHSELLVLRFLKLIKEKALDNSKISVHFTQKEKNSSSIKKINITDQGKLKDHWPDGFFKERLKELL